MQQPTPQPPGPPPAPAVITRISVAGLAAAFAASALVMGLITWPIHAMMVHRKLVYMQWHGAGVQRMGAYAGLHTFGPLHILVFVVLAAITGFVFAAVYNAVAANRP